MTDCSHFEKKLGLRVAAAFFLVCAIASAQAPDQWIDLFNGENLDGWVQRGGQAKYEVVDGMIVGSAVPKTPNSFLCTQREYADFELTLDFNVDDELNSGIQIRSASKADYKDGRVHGYQVEIDPRYDRSWSGGIYDEGRHGWLFDLSDNREARDAFKHNEWNSFRILAQRDRIQTWINGVAAADLRQAVVPSGFIGLQVHSISGAKPSTLKVRWRNIKLRDLTSDADPSHTETSHKEAVDDE